MKKKHVKKWYDEVEKLKELMESKKSIAAIQEKEFIHAIIMNLDVHDDDIQEEIENIVTKIKPEHFLIPAHGKIYSIIQTICEKPVKDRAPVTVLSLLSEKYPDDTYLVTLIKDILKTGYTPNIKTIKENLIDSIIKNHMAFSLFMSIWEIFPQMFKGESTNHLSETVEKLNGMIVDKLEEINNNLNYFENTSETLGKVLSMLEKWNDSDDEIKGFAAGIPSLDKVIGGFQQGDLVVIAARPGMGKTALATSIIANHIRTLQEEETLNVGFLSLEMPSEQIMFRLISNLSKVPFSKMRKGDLNDEDFSLISNALNKAVKANIMINDRSGLNILTIKNIVRKMQAESHKKTGRGLDCLFIDYLQLIHATGRHRERHLEVSEITRELKNMAKNIEAPVFALSQLNRLVEQRPGRKPKLSDLRESGSIEQDADSILFIYRDEVYNEDSKMKGKAEIIIGKNRHGATGEIIIDFIGDTSCFTEIHAEEFY